MHRLDGSDIHVSPHIYIKPALYRLSSSIQHYSTEPQKWIKHIFGLDVEDNLQWIKTYKILLQEQIYI